MSSLQLGQIRVFDTALFGRDYHWVDRLNTEKVERDGLPGVTTELHKGNAAECKESCFTRAHIYGSLKG